MKGFFSLAFNNLKRRKLRSWLTVIGVVIGVTAVVALILLGSGLQNAIQKQFEKAGTDKIIISPGRGAGGALGALVGADKFYDHDVDVIKKVGGVDKAGGMVSKMAKVEFRDEVKYTFVTGMPAAEITIEDFGGIKVDHGRELRSGDKYKAIMGYDISINDYFSKPIRVGKQIKIQDTEFEIIGSVERIGNRADDTGIYIPLEAAQEIFKEQGFTMMLVKVKEGLDAGEVAKDIERELRDDRDLKKGDEDFSVQTFEQLMETFSNILIMVQAVIIGIAAISLLVGGIGIMNTTYTSVLERTKEIGTMKAIGATNNQILALFLFESGLLGLVGGLIGVSVGIGIAKAAEYVVTQVLGAELLSVSLDPLIIGGALVFSFVIGTLSGLLPARQAANLKPVDALRYE